jgi:hypothetical protein
MAESPLPHVAQERRCDVLKDARLGGRDEAAEILHCLHETLREPTFVAILGRLVAGNDNTRNVKLRAARIWARPARTTRAASA